jgi:glycolate oxidase FAD binding subunit
VQERVRALKQVPVPSDPVSAVLDDGNSKRFWAMVRDVTPFIGNPHEVLWRISIPPADGARAVGEISKQLNARWLYDWGGGLVWISVDGEADDGGASVIRGVVAVSGGHATLVRASNEIKATVSVFHPPSPPVAALFRQVKQAFDPNGILNPGRMAVEG